MKIQTVFALAAVCGALAWPSAARAANPPDAEPIEVTIQLGTPAGDLVIAPGDLTFEKGKLYKLVIENPSDVEHRFSVLPFATSVRTHGKPGIDNGTVLGRPHLTSRVPFGYLVREIDVAPGGRAEWHFTPYEETRAKVGCAEKSHAAAGMMVTFDVI